MKQVYSLYEWGDRAALMIHQSQFQILALPMGVWSEWTSRSVRDAKKISDSKQKLAN